METLNRREKDERREEWGYLVDKRLVGEQIGIGGDATESLVDWDEDGDTARSNDGLL